MNLRPKILFITHDASRTGAPMILLHLLRWLHKNQLAQCDILFRGGGEMEADFSSLALQSYYWKKPTHNQSVLVRGIHRLTGYAWEKFHQNRLGSSLAHKQYDLVYANTIASCETLNWLRQYVQAPEILHVHELELSIQQFCNPQAFRIAQQHITRYLAVSKIVQDNLIQNHNINDNEIRLVYEFVPLIKNQIKLKKEEILKLLNIPDQAFIVGGSGSIHWRKGNDLFVQVAGEVYQQISRNELIYFLWIGGQSNQTEIHLLEYDVQQLGLTGRVLFPGSFTNPFDYFNVFDLLLMTSREDPFPLVCLEAGQLGKPIICFDKGVGSVEFIDDEVGAVVSYLDVKAMATTILALYHDQKKLKAAGEKIKERVEVFTVENAGPIILEFIQDAISNSSLN